MFTPQQHGYILNQILKACFKYVFESGGRPEGGAPKAGGEGEGDGGRAEPSLPGEPAGGCPPLLQNPSVLEVLQP